MRDLQQGASRFSFIFPGWECCECQVGQEGRRNFAMFYYGVSASGGGTRARLKAQKFSVSSWEVFVLCFELRDI